MSVYVLKPDNARERFKAAWANCCEYLQLEKSVKVVVEECVPTRTLEQNAKLHAICGELAHKRKWAGEFVDTEGWKRLLVDAWARATQRNQGHIVPSLDGCSVVPLGIQTRTMRIGDMSDLIEFAVAWCAQNEVELSQ